MPPKLGHFAQSAPRRRDTSTPVTTATTHRSILVAHDHALVRAGLRALLESLPGVEVVGGTGNGLEAVEPVRCDPPDVILLDVTLPGLNGLEAAARIRRLGVPTRVLMISMHAGPDYAVRAFAAGASGYLNKDSAFDELSTALEEICAGRRYLCRAVDSDLVQQHVQQAGNGGAGLDALTPRQRQILQMVVEGKSTRQIAGHLLISIKTVETHRAQLMQRLCIRDVPGLVCYAICHGLLPPEGAWHRADTRRYPTADDHGRRHHSPPLSGVRRGP